MYLIKVPLTRGKFVQSSWISRSRRVPQSFVPIEFGRSLKLLGGTDACGNTNPHLAGVRGCRLCYKKIMPRA